MTILDRYHYLNTLSQRSGQGREVAKNLRQFYIQPVEQ